MMCYNTPMTQTSPLFKQLLGGLVGIAIALALYEVASVFTAGQASLIRPSSPIANANIDRMRFADKNVDDGTVRQIAYRAQTLAKALQDQTEQSSSSEVSSISDAATVAALVNARRDMRLENPSAQQPVAMQERSVAPVTQETMQKDPHLSQSGVGLWMVVALAGGIAGISLSRKRLKAVH